MRSALGSWKNTLTRLGLRRTSKRGTASRRRQQFRRFSLETLEPRQMLSNDPIVVTTLANTVNANDGVLSFQEAITAANSNSGADSRHD
jgi:hypothetical protein